MCLASWRAFLLLGNLRVLRVPIKHVPEKYSDVLKVKWLSVASRDRKCWKLWSSFLGAIALPGRLQCRLIKRWTKWNKSGKVANIHLNLKLAQNPVRSPLNQTILEKIWRGFCQSNLEHFTKFSFQSWIAIRKPTWNVITLMLEEIIRKFPPFLNNTYSWNSIKYIPFKCDRVFSELF